MISARIKIIAMSIKYNGNWNKIYRAICHREEIEDKYIEKAEALKCGAITLVDADYPEHLKHVKDPPIVLYYYGDKSLLINYRNNISVVGSRQYSEYGGNVTTEIVGDLARRGYTIVSGLAIGIDTIAHQTAIDNGGKTIAVLPSGIDYCYPQSHKKIYSIIKKDHLLVSEIPGDTAPEPSSFPIRNRIIAGLSKTLLVTEAHPLSGSLITVLLALEGNSDVMCVPYPVGENSECNRIIQNGAYLVENADDVVNQMSKY